MNSLQKTNSISGGTSLESYERERCVGPVGVREMPWIRNQNKDATEAQMQLKVMKEYQKEERRELCAWQAGCLPGKRHRVFRRTQDSWIFCIRLHWVEILPKEFPFHVDFVFNYWQSETPAGVGRGGQEAWNPTWIQSLHPFGPQIPNLWKRGEGVIIASLQNCSITWEDVWEGLSHDLSGVN